MAEPALRLCADAGLSFEATDRALLVPCANAPVDLLLVRASDVPEYVQDGVVDLGITGANLVAEAAADVVTLAELGFARCTLAGGGSDGRPAYASCATSTDCASRPRIPSRPRPASRALGVEVELVPVSGSVEAAPRLGLSDAIVDLVSTGSTASANGLRLLGVLLESQAVLVGSEAALAKRAELVGRLELMISGVVAARRRRYLMMNAPTTALAEIRALLPGMGAPSVIDLADAGSDRGARGRRRGRRLGPARAAEGGRRVVDPRRCPSSGSSREGRRTGRGAAAGRGDRRRRPRAWRRGVSSTGRSSSTAARPAAPRSAGRARGGSARRRRARSRARAARKPSASFSEAQRPRDTSVEAVPGIVSERRWLPLSSVGIYVPGGRAAYPSSLVMAAVPARVAGVERIAVVTPRPAEATLAVARELGIDEVYAVGGAQAVAALAYGTETITPVDKIVGPGNSYVTAAKLLVSSRGRDRPAGRPERGRRDRRRDRRRRRSAPPTCSRRPSTAPTARRSCSPRRRSSPPRSRRSSRACERRASSESRGSTRRSLAPRTTRPSTSSCWLADAGAAAARVRNAGTVFVAPRPSSATTRPGRRTSCRRAASRAAAGGLGLESVPEAGPVRARDAGGSSAARRDRVPLARVEGLPLHAAALERAMNAASSRSPRRASAPYAWAPTVGRGRGAARAATRSRCSLRPEHAAAPRRAAGPARARASRG